MRDTVMRRIGELLLEEPGRSAAQITAAIGDVDVSRTVVNSVLYSRPDLFERQDDQQPPLWAVRDEAVDTIRSWRGPIATPPSTTHETAYAGPPLRAWQQEALDAWNGNDHRGIIESVTGSGKTIVGIVAAAEALDDGRHVVVLVPGTEQQEHWIQALRAALPTCRIGGLGGAAGSMPSHGDVLVATAYAVVQVRIIDKSTSSAPTVLIVDDVHSYSAGVYAKALIEHYEWRLGLTATAERPDDGVDTVLRPYFGALIPGCDYKRAAADGILPRVRVAQVGVRLTEREATRLHRAEALAERAMDILISSYGAPDAPQREFDAYVRLLAEGRDVGARFAKRYRDAIAERTEILANCEEKLDLVRRLPVRLLAQTQTIFFTDRAATAGQVTQILTEAGLTSARSGSGLSASERVGARRYRAASARGDPASARRIPDHRRCARCSARPARGDSGGRTLGTTDDSAHGAPRPSRCRTTSGIRRGFRPGHPGRPGPGRSRFLPVRALADFRGIRDH